MSIFHPHLSIDLQIKCEVQYKVTVPVCRYRAGDPDLNLSVGKNFSTLN